MWPMKQILWGGMDRRMVNFCWRRASWRGTAACVSPMRGLPTTWGAVREVVTRMLRYFQNEGMARLNRGVRLTER